MGLVSEIDRVSPTDLRVLVYNGDTDPSINSFEAANWVGQRRGARPNQR